MNSKALFILFSLVVVSFDGVWAELGKSDKATEMEIKEREAIACRTAQAEITKAKSDLTKKCNEAQIGGTWDSCLTHASTCKNNTTDYAKDMWSSSGSGIEALVNSIAGEAEEGPQQHCPIYTTEKDRERKEKTADAEAEKQKDMADIQKQMTEQKQSLSERKHSFENQSVEAADSIENLLNKKIDDVKAIEEGKENRAKELTLEILRKNEELVATQKAMQMTDLRKGFSLEQLMEDCFNIYDKEKERLKTDQTAKISQNQFFASDFKSLQKMIANNKNRAKQAYKKCKTSAERKMRIERAALDSEVAKLQMKIATIEGEIATLTQNFNELESMAMEKIEKANRDNDAKLATAKKKAEVMYSQMAEAIKLASDANNQLSSQYQMMQAQQMMSGNLMGMTFGNQKIPDGVTATVSDVLGAAAVLQEKLYNEKTACPKRGEESQAMETILKGAL